MLETTEAQRAQRDRIDGGESRAMLGSGNMPFPLSVEGRIEVPISSPEKASYVAEGIRQWLVRERARDVRWEGICLHFKGPPYDYMRRMHLRNALMGVDDSHIRFEFHPDKVIVEYSVSLEPIGMLLIPFCILVLIVAVGITDFRLLLLAPVAALAAYAFICIFRAFGKFELDHHFRIAAIRGLADGAERESYALQNQ